MLSLTPITLSPELAGDAEQKKIQTFVTSALLHAIILASLLYLFRGSPIPLDPPISVQINEPSPQDATGRSRKRVTQNQVHPTSKTARQVTLDDLGVKMTYSAREFPEETSVKQDADDGGWDLMNPDPKVAGFNQYIFSTIQRRLDYESMNNRRMLTGTVKVRLWFDPDGNFLFDETEYQAIDPDFQRIVARALFAAFQSPVPRPYLYSKEKFYVDREVFFRR